MAPLFMHQTDKMAKCLVTTQYYTCCGSSWNVDHPMSVEGDVEVDLLVWLFDVWSEMSVGLPPMDTLDSSPRTLAPRGLGELWDSFKGCIALGLNVFDPLLAEGCWFLVKPPSLACLWFLPSPAYVCWFLLCGEEREVPPMGRASSSFGELLSGIPSENLSTKASRQSTLGYTHCSSLLADRCASYELDGDARHRQGFYPGSAAVDER